MKRKYSAYNAGSNLYQSLKKRRVVRTAKSIANAIVAKAPGLVRRGGNYGRYGIAARQAGFAPELKFFDTALSFLVDATGEVPATGQLALIPQGDTESTRDGRMAFIKSIQIRANVAFVPAAAATAATNVFVYVILDTQANGAAAAATDVFTGTNFNTALINLNNSGRFRILKKIMIPMNAMAGVTTAYNNVVKSIDYYARCNIKMDWSSTTGAITEIRSNNIFLMAGSDGNSDDLVAVTGNARLRFQG